MITVDEARSIVLSHVEVGGNEKIDLLSALGRVIEEDIVASFDIPPWDNSAMDGYAVRFDDIRESSYDNPAILKVIEDLPAGYLPKNAIEPSQATRIMTGAPLPGGADTVVRQEDTSSQENTVHILIPPEKGANIRRAGENVKKGDRAIQRGTVLRPAHIGLLASLSRSYVSTYQVPKVAVLSTGDEVADIDAEKDPSKIVNSNTYAIASQIKECGATPMMLGIARDERTELTAKLKQGLSADVIITTGGVSVGEYDFVMDALKELGAELKFWKVAMRPGKPSTFGTIADKLLFGLPGNPVSCMVCFELFVRPALLKKMGHRHLFRPVVRAVLAENVMTKKGLRFFVRVRLYYENGQLSASTTGAQGSGILKSMVQANGLMIVSEDKEEVKAGEEVRVYVLDRTFELEEQSKDTP
jgi:molybdopterin molybdotransferase